MFVKVLKEDRPVALDGQTITIWPKDSVQECSEDFAAPLIRDRWVKACAAPLGLNGPTPAEHVRAGRKPENYPPNGFESIDNDRKPIDVESARVLALEEADVMALERAAAEALEAAKKIVPEKVVPADAPSGPADNKAIAPAEQK